jgi:hypothetical protein
MDRYITVLFSGLEDGISWAERIPQQTEDTLWRAISILVDRIEDMAMANLRSLAPYSQGGIHQSKERIDGSPSSPETTLSYGGPTAPYAPIYEFGGFVFPRTKPYLVFESLETGELIKAHVARHVPHPFFFPAIEEAFASLDEIFAEAADTIGQE